MEQVQKKFVRPAAEAAGEATGVSEQHAPRELSRSENVMLTIKILVVAALLLGALWGLDKFAFSK